MHGGIGWCAEPHGGRTLRKIYTGFDPATGDTVVSEPTTGHVGSQTAGPDLLDGLDADAKRFLAEGVCDGQSVYECLVPKYGPTLVLIVPIPKAQFLKAIRSANCISKTPPNMAE